MNPGLVSPWGVAADLLDPPAWTPDREPLLPHQVPPAGTDWTLWLLVSGRGAGKTEACARYMAAWMRGHPGHRGRIIAPTLGDAVASCVEGPSGLLSIDPDIGWHPSAPGGAKVVWPNSAEAVLIGTPTRRDADRLRAAGGRHLDWWEELAANPMLAYGWDQAAFGLREGAWPHTIGSTTPRPDRKFRWLVEQPGTRITRATLDDNPHLSAEWKAQLIGRYQGTRLWRQEILGEIILDVEGALWTLTLIDRARTSSHPDLTRVVVGVDPSGGAGEQGIIVSGLGVDNHVYVLDDRSCCLSPRGWASRAVQAYHDHAADRIVVERNYGGDMVAATIAGVDPAVPVTDVTASRGKQLRAEPVANLYGDPDRPDQSQPRIHHVGDGLTLLEDQMTTWTPAAGWSPDRVDALVWTVTELAFTPAARPVVEFYDPVHISSY